MVSKKVVDSPYFVKVNLSGKSKSIAAKSRVAFDFDNDLNSIKDPDSKQLQFVYLNYPLANQGVNVISYECVARGFQIVHESEEVVKETEKFLDDVNYSQKLGDLIVNTLVFGDGFFEIVVDEDNKTISDLVLLDSTVVDFKRDVNGNIIFDDEGNIKGYIQKAGGRLEDNIEFSPNEIAHFVFFSLRGRRKGISHLMPILRSVVHAMNVETSVAQAIYRHGFAQYDIAVGNEFKRPSTAQIDDVASAVEDLQARNEYVHSDDIKVSILEAKNTRNYDKYADAFIRNIVSGMGVPEPLLLGTGESSNKATADVQSRHFRSMIEMLQNKISSVVEDKIFSKLAELKGWTEIPKIEWNEVLPEEESAKVARVASLVQVGIVSIPEAREMLGLPAQPDFADSALLPKKPVLPSPDGAGSSARPLPERTGPKSTSTPPSLDRNVIPPFNRTQPSERGRASLKDNVKLNELRNSCRVALNHYFDTLRSSTINKIVSFNELSENQALAIPLDKLAAELKYNHKEFGSLIYIFMKEATKIGLQDSGCLAEGESPLLSKADAKFLDGFVDVVAKKELDDLFNKINWVVLNSFAKSESIEKMSEAINSSFNRFSSFETDKLGKTKVDGIVKSELNRGYNNGLLIGFARAGHTNVGIVSDECSSCSECNSEELKNLPISSTKGLLPLHNGCDCTFKVVDNFNQ